MRELLEVARWRRETRAGRPVHPTQVGFWPLVAKLRASRPPRASNGLFTAVLLVHKRPANIDLQIRAALHAEQVGHVVVSCNNPEVRLDRWIGVSSPRLRILEEQGRNQTRRYDVALAADGDRFVLPDDDVLMLPEAFDQFCQALPADGSRPVGLAGQRLLSSGIWELNLEDSGEEVDVLNRAYVCTREHAKAVLENAAALGWTDAETFSNPADDVLLSYAGRQNPTLAHVEHVNCVSHTDVQISTYRQAEFHELRSDWVSRLRELHGREPARRSSTATSGTVASPTGLARRVNIAAQPVRARFYRGRYVQSLSLLPRWARRSMGLDDPKSLRARRLQIGVAPFALEGFLRVDEHAAPNVTLRGSSQSLGVPKGFAMEIVALQNGLAGKTDALVAWRDALRPGGRAIVGLGSQDDVPAVSAALEAAGFGVVRVIPRGQSLESDPGVSPWQVELRGELRQLQPVPAIVDTAAEVFVVARAQ